MKFEFDWAMNQKFD